jgi:hypothetical protein
MASVSANDAGSATDDETITNIILISTVFHEALPPQIRQLKRVKGSSRRFKNTGTLLPGSEQR